MPISECFLSLISPFPNPRGLKEEELNSMGYTNYPYILKMIDSQIDLEKLLLLLNLLY